MQKGKIKMLPDLENWYGLNQKTQMAFLERETQTTRMIGENLAQTTIKKEASDILQPKITSFTQDMKPSEYLQYLSEQGKVKVGLIEDIPLKDLKYGEGYIGGDFGFVGGKPEINYRINFEGKSIPKNLIEQSIAHELTHYQTIKNPTINNFLYYANKHIPYKYQPSEIIARIGERRETFKISGTEYKINDWLTYSGFKGRPSFTIALAEKQGTPLTLLGQEGMAFRTINVPAKTAMKLPEELKNLVGPGLPESTVNKLFKSLLERRATALKNIKIEKGLFIKLNQPTSFRLDNANLGTGTRQTTETLLQTNLEQKTLNLNGIQKVMEKNAMEGFTNLREENVRPLLESRKLQTNVVLTQGLINVPLFNKPQIKTFSLPEQRQIYSPSQTINLQKNLQSQLMTSTQVQKMIQLQGRAQIQTPTQITEQRQITTPLLEQLQKTITPQTQINIPRVIIPFIEVPIIYLPNLNFPGIFDFGMGRNKIKGKMIKKYTPSYAAVMFNIHGKAPKGIETGLRLRPITPGFSWYK